MWRVRAVLGNNSTSMGCCLDISYSRYPAAGGRPLARVWFKSTADLQGKPNKLKSIPKTEETLHHESYGDAQISGHVATATNILVQNKNIPVPQLVVAFLYLPHSPVEAFPHLFPVGEEEQSCVTVASYRRSPTAVVKR